MKVCCYSVHAVRRSLLLASAKALPAITGIIPWSAAAQPLVPVRPYHCSQVVLAKAKKAGKGGKDSDDEEDATALPDMNALDRKMEDKIARLGVEFSNIRAGRASVDMFKDLKVDAFGTMTPLADVGQAVLSTPTKMTVTAFDTALAVPVADAIRGCGLNLNPTTDGNKITIVMPKPSAEARENLTKLASKSAEKFKQEVRQIRKDGMDAIKKIKSKISEDASKRFIKELEAVTEKKIEKISKLLKDKEKDIKSE